MHELINLSNGMRVVYEYIPYVRTVSMGIFVKAGSANEKAEENGLSHFIEHMLFKGTQQRTAKQIAEEMDAIGAQMNAFTSKECTCFYARAIDQNYAKAASILCDLFLNSEISQQELEKEKGVILEEISMVKDTPEDLVNEMLSAAFFNGSSLSQPILGTSSLIKAYTPESLRTFMLRHYRPDNSLVSVVGNIEKQRLVDILEQEFKDYNGSAAIGQPGDIDSGMARVAARDKDIEQVHISLAFPGVASDHDDVYPMTMFNNIFGGSMSSRLFQRIREELGMAYSVYSYPTAYKETGMLTIYAGASRENAEKVIQEIKIESERFLQNSFDMGEFEKVREQLKAGYIMGLESSQGRMIALGRGMLMHNRVRTEDEVLAKVDAVVPDDIMRVAENSLRGKWAAAAVGKNAASIDFTKIYS